MLIRTPQSRPPQATLHQAERVANSGVDAVGDHHEIGGEFLSIRERDRAFGRRGFDLRIEADLGARRLGALRQQGDDVLPVDPVRAARGLCASSRRCHARPRNRGDRSACRRPAPRQGCRRPRRCAPCYCGWRCRSLRRATSPVVRARAPSSPARPERWRQRGREAGAGDLDVSGLHRVLRLRCSIVARVRHKRKRPPAGELPEAAVSAVRSRYERRGSSKILRHHGPTPVTTTD